MTSKDHQKYEMNSVTLQYMKLIYYRNLLYFYSLTTKYQQGKLQKIIPFPTASQRIKCLGINLTKEVKDLYSKNCDIDKEIELKTIQIDGKIYCVLGLEELILLK